MSLLTRAFDDSLLRTGLAVVPATSDYSVCFWVEVLDPIPLDTVTALYVLFDSNAFSEYVFVGIDASGDIYVELTTLATIAGTAFTAGRHHIAYVREGTDHRLYVDGLIRGTTTYDASGDTFNQERLGGDTFATDWSPLRFWDVCNYARARTADEVFGQMLSNAPISTDALYSFTPLEGNLLDGSGNGRAWTQVGTPVFASQPEVYGIVTEHLSDTAMQDPGDYKGGFKAAKIMEAGEAESILSDATTGERRASTFRYVLSDYDRSKRQQIASATDRYWIEAVTAEMTTRDNRANRGEWYTIFHGPIIAHSPVPPLGYEITLGDLVGIALLNNLALSPWRQIGDGFLRSLTTIAEGLDKAAPEPIIYGRHIRTSLDVASPEGLVYTPRYLGTELFGGNPHYVWLVCGHAVADIPDLYVVDPTTNIPTSVIADEGTKWIIPHYTTHDTAFGAAYQDRRSDTYGDDRRYTLIRGKVGQTDPDACVEGTKILAVAVEGMEAIGDATGPAITDIFDQILDFANNYLANQGRRSYMSGARLTTPSWTIAGRSVPMIDAESIELCKAIAQARIAGGYPGAAIIGAQGQVPLSTTLAQFARSSGSRYFWTNLMQFRLAMTSPTAAIKAAAPLFTDATEILDGFGTSVQVSEQANQIPFLNDPEHTTGEFKGTGVGLDPASIANYRRVIPGDPIEYNFAPGITMGAHHARLEALRRGHPPRLVRVPGSVQPDVNGKCLGYLHPGDYLRYRHYASVSDAIGSIRLAQIERRAIHATDRIVTADALDVEDLIDYDAQPEDFGVEDNAVCADAITVPSTIPAEGYVLEQNTSAHALDATPPGLPGDANNAAWFEHTPTNTELATISTQGSDYDTVLAVFTGACGALTLAYINDNDDDVGLTTSQLNGLTLALGVSYKIVIYSFTPGGGNLKFSMSATEVLP